jgi:hypothetical protein
MEESAPYSKDPIVLINEILDLGNGQTLELKFNVRQSQSKTAKAAVLLFPEFFIDLEDPTISGRIGWIQDKLKEIAEDISALKKAANL